MKIIYFSLVGLFLAELSMAAPLQGFKCHVTFNVNGDDAEMELTAKPEGKYFLIDEKIPLVSKKAVLYVYYDGTYSAINLSEEKEGGRYYNSDSEVTTGKLFSLFVRGRDLDPAVDSIDIACKGY